MFQQSKSVKIWNLIYPVFIYFAVTTIALFVLDFILPETLDSKLFRQMLTSLAALPFLYSFYHQDKKLREKPQKAQAADTAVMFFVGGCFAMAWNNLLGMVHIADYSASYSQVEETFYTGKLALEIAALCVIIPIVEELLYRGIVYGRAKDWLGARYAVIVSAVIFGLIHMNLVQFIYASVFGLLLAYFMEVSGNLFGAAAAHMAANLTSVLRAETKIFAFMDAGFINQIVITAALAAAAGAGIFWLQRQKNK